MATSLALAIRNLPAAFLPEPPAPGVRAGLLERHGMHNPSLRRAIYLSCRAQVVADVSRRLDVYDRRRLA